MRSVRLVDDTVLYLHPEGEALSDAIAREGDYWERDILDYLADKHPRHYEIYDVGANIGNHTAYFAQYLEYTHITALEPVQSTFELLVRNTAPFTNVVNIQVAAGSKSDVVTVQPNRGNMGASEIRKDGEQEVQQITLDSLYRGDAPVTLLKIDVEWYEPQVLEGARQLIQQDKPLILIEDSGASYEGLFYNYEYVLEAGWQEHNTYLYRSKNA